MRIGKLVAAAALAATAAACGQGETQNVMVPRATPLTESQVERALGPEPQGPATNAAGESAEGAAAPAETGENDFSGEEQQ